MAAGERFARTLWMLSAVVFCLIGLTTRADANPGFARKYNVGCPMCHIAFPKLNDFGEQFEGNGYKFPGEDPAKYAVALGDERAQLGAQRGQLAGIAQGRPPR